MTFLIVFFIVLALAHTYIGRRLIKSTRFSPRSKNIFWCSLILMFFSPFLPILFRGFGFSNSAVSFFGWIGYTWLGFISLIFLLILFRDLGWGIGSVIKKTYRIFIKSTTEENKVQQVNLERRQFILQSVNLGLLGISSIGTGYGFYEARRDAAIIKVDIPLKNLPDDFNGIKIAQFSDLHAGPTIKRDFIQNVVNRINNLKTDIIVFTGDLVDGSVENLQKDVEPLNQLEAPYGKYFVTGNHEYYFDALPWCDAIRDLGFEVLLNENRIINKQTGNITLAGVTDFAAGNHIEKHKSDPWQAIKGAEPESTKILLAHQPRSIFDAAKAGYDLQISGHTHGGQLIPWQYLTRLAQPYMSGLHKHENTWIYVNQGTGYWGPPLRIGARSEITILRLIKET